MNEMRPVAKRDNSYTLKAPGLALLEFEILKEITEIFGLIKKLYLECKKVKTLNSRRNKCIFLHFSARFYTIFDHSLTQD